MPWPRIGEWRMVSPEEIIPSTYSIECFMDSKPSVHILQKKKSLLVNVSTDLSQLQLHMVVTNYEGIILNQLV
jgi:hypothetical protein